MNRRGKKVLDIDWESEGVKIRVPVKAFEKKNWNTDEIQMIFRATFPDAGIDVENTDINVIRKEIIEKLDQWYKISWELFFRVEVDGGDSGHGDTKFSVEFEMDFFVVGKDSRGTIRHMRIPRPDEKDIRNFNGKPTQWSGEQPQDGMPQTGTDLRKDSYGLHRGHELTRALVKATPENVKAADQFVVAMKGLLDKMHHHFAPGRIEALLQNTALLLPAPKK